MPTQAEFGTLMVLLVGIAIPLLWWVGLIYRLRLWLSDGGKDVRDKQAARERLMRTVRRPATDMPLFDEPSTPEDSDPAINLED